jgi:hypothetical protein
MYKISRINDGKTFEVNEYKFIVFKNGRGKEMINNPIIGSALILPPYNSSYRWLTSPITEVIDNYHFKTLNSEYKIEKL